MGKTFTLTFHRSRAQRASTVGENATEAKTTTAPRRSSGRNATTTATVTVTTTPRTTRASERGDDGEDKGTVDAAVTIPRRARTGTRERERPNDRTTERPRGHASVARTKRTMAMRGVRAVDESVKISRGICTLRFFATDRTITRPPSPRVGGFREPMSRAFKSDFVENGNRRGSTTMSRL